MGVRALVVLVVAVVVGSLCGAPVAAAAPGPRLTDSHPCAGQPGFTCAMLTVPLDHRGRTPGSLRLQVAAADNADAPKGVLLFLTGGPGQPGVPAITRLAVQRLPEIARNYRFVMIDQRGTGEFGAVNCPTLQAQVGSSDIATPTPDAVRECAAILGQTAPLYSTEQTVADLDLFRRALGVEKITVDGVSYGTFTAERYAIAHPRQVRALVLDSVVPHHVTAADSLYLVALRAQAGVLRNACATPPACGFDPAEDLAQIVRERGTADGVRIFDMIVTYEFLDPSYRQPTIPGLPPGVGDLVGALHAARTGNPAPLDTLLEILASGGDPVTSFSSGLHAATLCADMRFPWGTSATPQRLRPFLLAHTQATLRPDDVYPYTSAVATHQGFIQTCLPWPTEPSTPDPNTRLPDVPTLLINGDHDLSTPVAWARQEAATSPHPTLTVVAGASHSIQNREQTHTGRDAVIRFLNSN
jgi:pimeloyl-ACP methyl ester carboxylesterase